MTNLFRPLLELAYWIGPQPGVWNSQLDDDYHLADFRDRRTSGRTNVGERDRWVVFHFHFNENRNVFIDQGGHTYAAFVSHVYDLDFVSNH
jgi:hypothetical protein